MAEQMLNAEAYIPERPRLGPRLLRRKVGEALRAFHFKLWLVNLLLGPLPILVGKRLRAQLYRFAGFRIGPDSRFLDRATFDALGNPYPNLTIGRRSQVGIGCHFSLNAPVSIGDDVIFGHYVRILTDTHALGPSIRRCGERIAQPVVIEDGVWLASNVVLLPGVTVGRGSVVASGAVVARDVPPNCAVGGVPARVLRTLPEGPPRDADLAQDLAAAEMTLGGSPGLAEELDGRTADVDARY
jgi:acetyltransferase-like isoleucine patch superfamily enzyme